MKIKIRLYYPAALSENQVIAFDASQTHYLKHVMRVKEHERLYSFNATDGEWVVQITSIQKKEIQARVITQSKPPQPVPDVWLCFAPVKNAPLHTLVQKATELGVSGLYPITTEHTIVHRINSERITANAIEAAEQCRRTCIPHIAEAQSLSHLIKTWDPSRKLILCDESGQGTPIATALSSLPPAPHALLIGPEGGFSATELDLLHQADFTIPVCLGPRILRADTAAIASLSCLMSTLGDWQQLPNFNESHD